MPLCSREPNGVGISMQIKLNNFHSYTYTIRSPLKRTALVCVLQSGFQISFYPCRNISDNVVGAEGVQLHGANEQHRVRI